MYKQILAAGLAVASVAIAAPLGAQTIVDEWASVKMPAPPALKPAKVDPKTTALLLFDFTHQTCSQERRPRCAASVPKLKKLLDDARANNMFVVWSVATADSKPSDILPEIAPRAGEPVLPSLGPDKFIKSDFEKMLHDRGVKTVIITGTAAHTTVLHTGAKRPCADFQSLRRSTPCRPTINSPKPIRHGTSPTPRAS